jgi:hypothetical protein
MRRRNGDGVAFALDEIAERFEQPPQFVDAAMHVADHIEGADIVPLVGPHGARLDTTAFGSRGSEMFERMTWSRERRSRSGAPRASALFRRRLCWTSTICRSWPHHAGSRRRLRLSSHKRMPCRAIRKVAFTSEARNRDQCSQLAGNEVGNSLSRRVTRMREHGRASVSA